MAVSSMYAEQRTNCLQQLRSFGTITAYQVRSNFHRGWRALCRCKHKRRNSPISLHRSSTGFGNKSELNLKF